VAPSGSSGNRYQTFKNFKGVARLAGDLLKVRCTRTIKISPKAFTATGTVAGVGTATGMKELALQLILILQLQLVLQLVLQLQLQLRVL
jgi:hypothetical protein